MGFICAEAADAIRSTRRTARSIAVFRMVVIPPGPHYRSIASLPAAFRNFPPPAGSKTANARRQRRLREETMNTRRRDFLRVCGLGMAGALATPAVAGATRIRILEEAGESDRPILSGQVSPDFQRFMAGIRVGPARAHGALMVFWLHAKEAPAALEVSTLDEARARGALVITERDQATVPELLVDNRGKSAVLMLAGEILIGGKQNRVLKEDILLPPLSGPRNIFVYCVERGRWNEGRKEFESKSSFAQPGVRAQLMRKAPQSEVWLAVGQAARAVDAASPTESYQHIYEKAEVKTHLI